MTKQQHIVVLIFSLDGDWQGLFVDGKLVYEGHELGEGRPQRFWLNIGTKYGITGDDLIIKHATEEDDERLDTFGGFPKTLSEMKGKYQR